MKKAYLKPDAEYVRLLEEEILTDKIVGGDIGLESMPEGGFDDWD